MLSDHVRQIVSFEVPTFSIALARLTDSRLRDRPVAVVPALTSRVVLQEVSSEAEREGLVAGMSVRDATRFCPGLQVLPFDPLHIRQANQQLFEIVARVAPIWEPRRPGHWFLDLTGTTRLFGVAADTTARIQREVARQSGLATVAGVSNTKLVSRIAARQVAPSQLYEVRPGSEQAFLAPLPISALPGLHEFPKSKFHVMLEDLNIMTVGDLAAITRQHLELIFGQQGLLLHNWAQGIDASPVLSPSRQKCFEESFTLESDELDETRLLGLLFRLLERLCRRLRRQQQVCHGLALTLRYCDHVSARGQQMLSCGTQWEAELFAHVTALFHRSFRRRVRIRSLTLGVEYLASLDNQLSLFPETTSDRRPRLVTLALDRLRDRFGEESIQFGRSLQAGPFKHHVTL